VDNVGIRKSKTIRALGGVARAGVDVKLIEDWRAVEILNLQIEAISML